MNPIQRVTLRFCVTVLFLLAFSTLHADIIYVDNDANSIHNGQSWPTAFHKLQDALAIAVYGDEIYIAQGVYRPDETSTDPEGTGDRTATFNLAEGLTLLGGFIGFDAADPNLRDPSAYETILSGDLDNNDTEVSNASSLLNDPNRAENSYHVISISNAGSNLLIDGLTIAGGIANGTAPDNNGAGFMISYSNPTISNCHIEYNAAANGGAVYNLTSNPVFTDCLFLRNYALDAGGAIRNISSASPNLTGCNFIENKAPGFGGAIANYDNSSPLIAECTFSYNWSNQGGAINNYEFCSPFIVNSMFLYNTTDANGGAVSNQNHSDVKLINCGLFSNAAPYGAGLYNYQSNPSMVNSVAAGNLAVESGGVLYNRDAIDVSITNCTFVANTANVKGAVVYNVQSNPAIQNCILWDNTDPNSIPVYTESGTPTVNYSCIEGGWVGGTGNIDTDPLFIDPNGLDGILGTMDDNFKLFTDSPCVDAANNTVVPADTADLDNDIDLLERIPLDYYGRKRFCNIPDVIDSGIADPPTYPDVIDMGASERNKPILVDILAPGPEHDGTEWGKAFNHLQDALAIVEKGDVILVAQGVYYPDRSQADPTGSGNRTAAFELIDSVALKGGYAGWSQTDPNIRNIQAYPTILSGDLLNNDTSITDPAQMINDPSRLDNSYHIIMANNIGVSTELSGFTITGGIANGTDPHNTGGGIRMVSSDPSVNDCSFEYNAAEYGGAVYNALSNPTFTLCSYYRNYADNHGGAVRNYDFSSPELVSCSLAENKATGYGGAIANSGNSSPIATQCSFSSNWANQGGAAINNYGYCNPKLTQSIFEYNTTNNTGGAVRNENNSNTESTSCNFTANTAVSGGAIYNTSSDPTVADCNFIDNATTGNGGAIFNTNSSLSIQSSVFQANQSDSFGGALYNVASNPLDITDCSFSLNTALSGGVLYNDSCDPTVTGCNFINNTATENGGAIFSTTSSLIVQTSTFTTNQAGNYGGALYNVISSPLDASDCSFTSNTAIRGGAVFGENSTATIDDSTFIANTTTNGDTDTDESGGAIFNDSDNISITRSFFQNNESYVNGGAVYNTNGDLSVENSVFRDNLSGKNGGGICHITANTLTLKSCILSSNTTSYDGGGIYIQNVTNASLANCLITYNNAVYGGGIMNTGATSSNLIHCTLSSNTAGIGEEIYNSGAIAVIQNSIVLDSIIPNDSVTIDYSCVPNWTGTGTGNTTLAPAFVDPDGPDGTAGTEDDNFRLTSGSPCLDAADNTAIPAGLETDLDGYNRIVDADCSGTTVADMGAYEFSYLPMGDFDSNCGIDLYDFATIGHTWLLSEGDPLYDLTCDISTPQDNTIDWQDLIIMLENWMLGT